MYLLGILIFLGGFYVTLWMKHVPLDVMANPASLIMTLTAVFAVLTATRGFQTFVYGLKAAVNPKTTIPDEELGRAASLFRLLSKTTAISMASVMLVGAISVLRNMQNVEIMGHGLAAALVSPLWALTLIVAVFEPVVFIMKKRQAMERGMKNGRKEG